MTGQSHSAWIGGVVSCEECHPTESRVCWRCREVMHPLDVPRWILVRGSLHPVCFRDCRPSPPSLLDRLRVWWGNHIGAPEIDD